MSSVKVKAACATGQKVLFAHGYPRPTLTARRASGFDVAVTHISDTPHVKLYIDQALDSHQATTLAHLLLGQVENAYRQNAEYFSSQLHQKQVNMVIAKLSAHSDGSGGAFHYGCDLTSG